MIRAHVLWALSCALEQGKEDAARSALGRVDPVLRPLARARLRRALRDAWLAADATAEAPHVLRVAFLDVAGALPDGSLFDKDAVRAAYEQARARSPVRPPGRPALTIAAGVLATAAVIWVAIVAATAPTDPRATPLGKLLGRKLPAYAVELDHFSHDRRNDDPSRDRALSEARAPLVSDEARSLLGERGAKALSNVLSSAEALAADSDDGRPETFRAALADLNEALREAGEPYFVDGDYMLEGGVPSVPLFAFAIERERELHAGDRVARLLWLRRIDRLNWDPPYLGFTRESMDVALVLLDKVDEMLVRRVLPALVPGAPMSLGGGGFGDPPAWLADAEVRAGRVARDELSEVPGLDASAAVRLGNLLDKRQRQLERMRGTLRAKGAALVMPLTVRTPDTLMRSLESLVDPDDLRALSDISSSLDDERNDAVLSALREVLVVSVERHEAQHRIDLAPGAPRVLSEAVRRATGTDDDEPPRWAWRVHDELSAYLSEIARDERTSRLNLSLVTRFVLDPDQHGTAESYAAVVLLEALAEATSIPTEPLVGSGHVQRRRAAALYLKLSDLPTERLREGAKAAWEELFGAELLDFDVRDKSG